MKTFVPKREEIKRKWWIVDADGKVLGRLASKVASVLRGKHKPIYTPHLDTGDHVVVVNAAKVRLTGNKLNNKIYQHHSGYPGGLKSIRCKDLLSRYPEKVVTLAIKGMLPHNRLGRKMLKKLRVYRGDTHPHNAQKPIELKI